MQNCRIILGCYKLGIQIWILISDFRIVYFPIILLKPKMNFGSWRSFWEVDNFRKTASLYLWICHLCINFRNPYLQSCCSEHQLVYHLPQSTYIIYIVHLIMPVNFYYCNVPFFLNTVFKCFNCHSWGNKGAECTSPQLNNFTVQQRRCGGHHGRGRGQGTRGRAVTIQIF